MGFAAFEQGVVLRPVRLAFQDPFFGKAAALDLIQDALKTTRGNRAKAARLLNTTKRILNYQVRKYGIDWQRFKGEAGVGRLPALLTV